MSPGIVTVPTAFVQIWIAGDPAEARRLCREWCDRVGACVTVTETSYVFTGGEERGVVVGFINYGRFPSSPEQIMGRARDLAEILREGLAQQSYSIQGPEVTRWVSWRPEDLLPG